MAGRFSSWSGQHGLILASLMLVGAAAFAQDGPGPLPVLPGVPDEVATPASQAPSPLSGLFATETEAREKLREAFARHEYSTVLGIADRIHAQFPDATFTRYYETTARLQISDRATEADRLPYRRLDSLPPSSVIHAMTTRTAAASPAPAAPQAAPDKIAPPPASTQAAAAPPAPIPAAQASALERLKTLFEDNPLYLWIGGGGLLVFLLLIALVLRRRRRAAAASEAEDFYGAPEPAASAPEPAAEYPAHSSGTTAFFRSEVQAMANGWADSMSAPVATQAIPQEEEEILKPEIEPIFALADDDEPEAEPLVAGSQPEPPLADLPEFSEIVLDDDLVTFDDDLDPQPQPETQSQPDPQPQPQAAPPEGSTVSFVEDSLLTVDEPQPQFPEGQVGESLYIDEEPLSLEAVAAAVTPAPIPDQVSDSLDLPSVPLSGLDGSELDADSGRSTLHSPTPEESFAMADDATQTAYPESIPGEETIVSLPDPEEELAPASGDPPSDYQVFHPGETLTLHVEAEDPAPPPPAPVAAHPRSQEVKLEPQDIPEDVFDREYHAGLREAEAHHWVEAIHHLSVAAALRPGALEVKEHLREARRMRARELEGRI